MSERNHFVLWKGSRSGPFSKEELEKEFIDGKIGLVRTVSVGGISISGREFVADLESIRRDLELEEQLQVQAREIESSRIEMERLQEEHRLQLEEASKRPAGKTTPPPIPDFNPWAPSVPPAPLPPTRTPSSKPSFAMSGGWLDGKWPVIIAASACVLCLMTGQIVRETTGIIALVLAVILLVRKRTLSGMILILCALLSYGAGFLLSDLMQDYLAKNYPN